ncbi:MAG: FHA domain-containing protein [Pyrinomonadaceae bacterium]|nr:FHA domain-containing protein [Pyrinomonadaceae bacterium]
MTELFLKFTDENGAVKNVSVNSENFFVGRISTADLSIADGRLSREHLKIERFSDIFVVTDLGSSNGTTINGRRLDRPTTLQNGDVLNLGGLEIKAEIISDKASNASFGSFDDDFAEPAPKSAEKSTPAEIAPSLNQPKPQTVSASANPGAFPKSFFYIAPVFGLMVLLIVVVSLYVFGGKKEVAVSNSDFIYTSNTDEADESKSSKNSNEDSNETNEKPPQNSSVENNSAASENSNEDSNENPASPTPTPANLNDTAKIEQNSASFLRKIAQNNPKAFLTTEQSKIVGTKIKQFSGSSAIADNIKSARANASQIQALANSKNLKPQFLVCAALAKLGNSRGNVLQMAQSMTGSFDKTLIHIGNELADDALLMIAVSDRSEVIPFRNMLQELSNEFPESSRTIRTIWFLKQKGKITDAEYEFALRFLAIGTITQNPKDFNVNAEELKLN